MLQVDTTRIAAGEDFLTNQQNMRMKVDKAWALILSSYPKFPPGLPLIFQVLKLGSHEALLNFVRSQFENRNRDCAFL